MSILTRNEILSEIKEGRIKIEPIPLAEQIGPASIDLHLDNQFRIFKKPREIYHVEEDSKYEDVTELVIVKDRGYLLLNPGESAHGITKEKITLPEDICGWLQGRSRFSRIGLMIHISANFMQPGISNRQVLEMSNLSPIPLAIYPGTKVCQFIFQRCEGKAKYAGKFKTQINL